MAKKSSKQFRIENGELRNRYNQAGEFNAVCSYVPMNAEFEPVVEEQHERAVKNSETIDVFQMQDGKYYRTNGNEQWAEKFIRKGSELFYSDKFGRQQSKVLDLGLGQRFVEFTPEVIAGGVHAD